MQVETSGVQGATIGNRKEEPFRSGTIRESVRPMDCDAGHCWSTDILVISLLPGNPE
jgi:hypothetical protein